MPDSIGRRGLLVSIPAALGTFLLDPPTSLLAAAEPAPGSHPLPANYPAQDPELVREVVAVSHFDVARVRALVEKQPELAKAAWDWGFGDWETALGAASHTGGHEIVALLIENGARPDLFTVAMSGNLAAVRAFVAATPGIQRLPGPHGITLRKHAELGGERARAVLDYLDELGDADRGSGGVPLELEQEAFVGTYDFGDGENEAFEVEVSRMGGLAIRRGSGTPRGLSHQGAHTFHPAGAPSVRLRFVVENGAVRALEIPTPRLTVIAKRRAAS